MHSTVIVADVAVGHPSSTHLRSIPIHYSRATSGVSVARGANRACRSANEGARAGARDAVNTQGSSVYSGGAARVAGLPSLFMVHVREVTGA